ncbi:hypothetical protein ACRYCC_34150 [Actinomadura scrupuli]|uniref:hypothetical protein n=1 Tax=Actinomadura scrupuli TaxID=559629 RepID=UPI003D987BF5
MLSVPSACARGGDGKTASPLPINPTPTSPGQVVVLAGNGEQKKPVDGAFATRSPVYASGAIAAAPDGSIFTFADNGRNRTLVRIGSDGRVHVLPVLTPLAGRVVLAATRTGVWSMDTGEHASLTRTALDGSGQTLVFGPAEGGPTSLTFVDAAGRLLPEAQRRTLLKRWKPSAMAVRDDGIPVVATEDGSLYEALGQGKLRPWTPAGYADAVRKARTRQGTSGPSPIELSPSAIMPGRTGEVIVVGTGIIHVPRRGEVKATGFRVPHDVLWRWSGGVALNDGSLLLLETNIGRLLRVAADGSLYRLPAFATQICTDYKPVVGPSRRPDGTIALGSCGRLLGFRPPMPQGDEPMFPGYAPDQIPELP